MEITIKCVSGYKAPLGEFLFQDGHLKQHSDLEINRLCNLIKTDGFLFPVLICKINGKSYIIDGECRILALYQLQNEGYTIPEIPYCLTKATPETIRRITISNVSTNHSVTQFSLENYAPGIDMKEFAFNTPDLVDFRTIEDVELYESTLGGKSLSENGPELKKEDFIGMLAEI